MHGINFVEKPDNLLIKTFSKKHNLLNPQEIIS